MTATKQATGYLLEFAREHFGGAISPEELHPIHQGASGRTIVRISAPEAQCVAVCWTGDRPDNASFVPAALLLRQCGVLVPEILAHKETDICGMALVSDLGDTNLLSLKETPWKTKRKYYSAALVQVHRLHNIRLPGLFKLQPEFDEPMYRWEQEYFAEHIVEGLLGLDRQTFLSQPACSKLASTLSRLPRKPVHRDFQSQNIHLFNRQAWLIDFQGMRLGLPEYDLASLVYDPYANLAEDQRNELIAIWNELCESPADPDILRMCALQRLMQALGAFGKLSRAGNSWYGAQIPPAMRMLREISSTSLLAEPIEDIVECYVSL